MTRDTAIWMLLMLPFPDVIGSYFGHSGNNGSVPWPVASPTALVSPKTTAAPTVSMDACEGPFKMQG